MKKALSLSIIAGYFIVLSSNEKMNVGEMQYKDNPGFSKIISDFEKQLYNDIAKDSTGSISAVIFKGDEIIWSKAFGKSNNQKNMIADSNTVYRIGSISKTITAYLVMLLVQNGTIRLDDPVAKYLPEIKLLKHDRKNAGADITLRQLADHSSGLEKEPDGMDTARLGRTEDWENMLLEAIPKTGFHFPVGQQYWYSNIGYAFLGLAISRAAHKPFIDLVNDMVFEPHGMKNSFYIIPKGFENRIASGYHWYPSSETYSTEFADRQLVGRNYTVPPGGVFSTIKDLARFAMALTADSDILEKKYQDTMQTVQASIRKANDEGYGLGLFIRGDNKGVKKIGHDGQVAGFNAFMVFNPDTRIGVVLLRNCDNASANLQMAGNVLLARLVKSIKK